MYVLIVGSDGLNLGYPASLKKAVWPNHLFNSHIQNIHKIKTLSHDCTQCTCIYYCVWFSANACSFCDEPTLISGLAGKQVIQIACGSTHSAAVTSEGELYTWGRGSYGRLGHGKHTDKYFFRVTFYACVTWSQTKEAGLRDLNELDALFFDILWSFIELYSNYNCMVWRTDVKNGTKSLLYM